MCFLWFIVHFYFVLTPVGCFLLGQWRALDSGSRVRVCFPDYAAVPAVWAVLGSMDDPGVGFSTSLTHFLSSLLPSACHGHQISSPGVFQPARSVSVMCSPFPPLCPHSFPALVFMVSQICFKSSWSYLSALKTDASAWKTIIALQEARQNIHCPAG